MEISDLYIIIHLLHHVYAFCIVGSLTAHMLLPTQEPSIVHAGAVVSILHLVPAITFPQNAQVANNHSTYISESIF